MSNVKISSSVFQWCLHRKIGVDEAVDELRHFLGTGGPPTEHGLVIRCYSSYHTETIVPSPSRWRRSRQLPQAGIWSTQTRRKNLTTLQCNGVKLCDADVRVLFWTWRVLFANPAASRAPSCSAFSILMAWLHWFRLLRRCSWVEIVLIFIVFIFVGFSASEECVLERHREKYLSTSITRILRGRVTFIGVACVTITSFRY